MKQTRRRAAPVVAALALAGALAWTAGGVGGAPRMASAMSDLTPALPAASSTLAMATIEQAASEPLTTGCNQITLTGLPVGSKVGPWVSSNIQPSSAVVSVWHYDNGSQKYQAFYFQDQNVPVDQTTFPTAIDAFFVCVNSSATAP